MTLEELNQNIDSIYKEYESKRKDLVRKYCDANNPYKIGDKFTDHNGTILIESIKYNIDYMIKPCCIYFGRELKKDGKLKKNMAKRNAWQLNDIKLQK